MLLSGFVSDYIFLVCVVMPVLWRRFSRVRLERNLAQTGCVRFAERVPSNMSTAPVKKKIVASFVIRTSRVCRTRRRSAGVSLAVGRCAVGPALGREWQHSWWLIISMAVSYSAGIVSVRSVSFGSFFFVVSRAAWKDPGQPPFSAWLFCCVPGFLPGGPVGFRKRRETSAR